MENNLKQPINHRKLRNENYDEYITAKINNWESKLIKYKKKFNLLRNPNKSEYTRLSKDLKEGHLEPWGWTKFIQTKRGQQAQKLLENNLSRLRKAEKRLEYWENEKKRREYEKNQPKINFEEINSGINKIREKLNPHGIKITQTSKGIENNREWRIYTISDGNRTYDFYINQSGNWYLVNIHDFKEKIECNGMILKKILKELLKRISDKFKINQLSKKQVSILNFKIENNKDFKSAKKKSQARIDKYF